MTDERRTIPLVPSEPWTTAGLEVQVPLRDAISAVQNAGYLVYEIGELPEVTDGKLPSTYVAPATWRATPKAQQLYTEAFEKLALARWWEKEAERKVKQIEALASDLLAVGNQTIQSKAEGLVERGWTRG